MGSSAITNIAPSGKRNAVNSLAVILAAAHVSADDCVGTHDV
jgi:hypothetical protein